MITSWFLKPVNILRAFRSMSQMPAQCICCLQDCVWGAKASFCSGPQREGCHLGQAPANLWRLRTEACLAALEIPAAFQLSFSSLDAILPGTQALESPTHLTSVLLVKQGSLPSERTPCWFRVCFSELPPLLFGAPSQTWLSAQVTCCGPFSGSQP